VFWFLFTNFIPAFFMVMGPNWVDKYLIINIIGFVFALGILIGFFYAPQFLYGKSFLKASIIKNDDQYDAVMDSQDQEFPTVKNNLLINKIDIFFTNNTSFLDVNFNILTLSELIQSNQQLIEKAIKENYYINFEQYLSRKRFKFFKDIYIQIPLNRNKSIEKIAEELGFVNLQNFYHYFNNYFQTTPIDYLEKFKETRSLKTVRTPSTKKEKRNKDGLD